MRRFHHTPSAPTIRSLPGYDKNISGIRGDIGETDELCEKHGWWKHYYREEITNETLWSHGKTIQDRQYTYGRLSQLTHVKPTGIREIMLVDWSGSPTLSVQKKGNLRHGVYREWDDRGNIFLKATFTKDKLNGVVKIYYTSGKVRESCRYLNGVQHGLVRFYYENGNIKHSARFVKGKLSGWCYSWAEEGTKLSSFYWRAMRMHNNSGNRGSAQELLGHLGSTVMTYNFGRHILEGDAWTTKENRLSPPLGEISTFRTRYLTSLRDGVDFARTPLLCF